MTEALYTQELEAAKADLAANMVPAPEDILSEIAPLTRLYFVEQCLYELLNNFVAMAASSEGDPEAEASHLPTVIEALAKAAGAVDAACVYMGLLPLEAIESPSNMEN